MGRIKSFVEYEKRRDQREHSKEADYHQEIARIISLTASRSAKDIEKMTKDSDFVVRTGAIVLQTIMQEERKMLREIMGNQHGEEIRNKLRTGMIKGNIEDLVSCIFTMEKGLWTATERRQAYGYLTTEMHRAGSDIMSPENLRQELKELRKRGYVPKKIDLSRLVTALSQDHRPEVEIKRVHPKISEPAPKKVKDMERDQRISYMVDDIGIPYRQAVKLKLSSSKLKGFYNKLREVAGDKASELVTANPSLLTYERKVQREYLGLLGKVMEVTDIKTSDACYLEKLRKAHREATQKIEPTGESFQTRDYAHYPFLHRGKSSVEDRLQSLVDTGRLSVADYEHWGGESKGARGKDILKNIKQQMTALFSTLGYDQPRCTINFGQSTMHIDRESQEVLRTIRDEAYANQQPTSI